MMTWNGFYFHSPSSYLMELLCVIQDYVMMFLSSMFVLVLINLTYTFFCKSYNLIFSECHQLETLWTIAPFLILTFVVVPSIQVLYLLDTCIFCGVTLGIMGHQWYWSYFYKDLKDYSFDSYMSQDNSILRLIDVDNRVILPTLVPIRFLVSSADVIHSWTIPSLGVKMDAVPGRINQFCVSVKRSGIFFGQCSEICGANHSFMPIVMESVPINSYLKI